MPHFIVECSERLISPEKGKEVIDLIHRTAMDSGLFEKANIKVYKTYVGNYMTAIDMAGASITLLKLDDELKELLDEPVDTIALKQ